MIRKASLGVQCAATVIAVCAAAACSSSNSGSPSPDGGADGSSSRNDAASTPEDGGSDSAGSPSVSGSVTYNGTHSGTFPLTVALFNASLQPVLAQQFTGLTWPGTHPYTLSGAAAGMYGVVSYINVSGAQEEMAGPNDPNNLNCGLTAVPMITVTAGQTVTADVTLTDVTVSCGGDDGGHEDGATTEGGAVTDGGADASHD